MAERPRGRGWRKLQEEFHGNDSHTTGPRAHTSFKRLGIFLCKVAVTKSRVRRVNMTLGEGEGGTKRLVNFEA